MTPTIEIRRNADGVIRTCQDHFPWDEASEGSWSDGNNSCDCNRFLYFARAAGEEPEWDDNRCGDGGYSVRITENGKTLYEDEHWATSANTASPD